MPKPYNDVNRKRIDLILSSLIKEAVTVKLETIDYTCALLSIQMGTIYTKSPIGIALAFRNEELKKIRDAIDDILTEPREFS